MEQCLTTAAPPAAHEIARRRFPHLPAGERCCAMHFPNTPDIVFHDRAATSGERPNHQKEKRHRGKRARQTGQGTAGADAHRCHGRPFDDHLVDAGAICFDRDFDRLSGVRFDVDALMLRHDARTALVDALAASLATHYVSSSQRPSDLVLASLGDDMGRLAVLVGARSGLSVVELVSTRTSGSCILLVSTIEGDAVHRTVRHLRNKGLDVLGLFVLFSSHFLHDTERLQALGLPAVVLTNVAMAVDRAHHTGRLSAADVRRARDLYAPRII
ncbi:hypothetical protein pclt_cds_763 [Pandoravirus celtis]|uniref:Uncharacterized protein n=1 Tax=Pandoravirus celtis TaxID=2568002 RepID=A0A4D6EJK5_9VIRU|nr:hypothetical protein pclt_cds_763 [Pandoravirus celtis]